MGPGHSLRGKAPKWHVGPLSHPPKPPPTLGSLQTACLLHMKWSEPIRGKNQELRSRPKDKGD